MRKITFQVEGMHCTNCAFKIEGLEDNYPDGWIKRIEASYHKNQVVVEFDEQNLLPEDLVAAIEEQGYSVEKIF